MFKTGDSPGEGKFRCKNCGHVIELKNNEELPECPECGHKEFERQ